jgi:periplasmic protein TonB
MSTTKFNWNYLVFEYRNKAYGAYLLRSRYHKHLALAAFFTMLCFALAFIMPGLFHRFQAEEIEIQEKSTQIIYYAELAPPPPIEKIYIPPKTKAVNPSSVRKVVKYVAPKVTKEEVPEQEEIPTVEDIKSNLTGTVNIEGTGGDVYEEPVKMEVKEDIKEPKKEEKKEKVVYNFVEKQPEYPGGMAKLFKYLSENIQYPIISSENGIQGTVFVQFTVDVDGSINDIMIVKGLDNACNNEALRVIKAMPHWVPGQQNGKPVNVRYTLPIRFVLQ